MPTDRAPLTTNALCEICGGGAVVTIFLGGHGYRYRSACAAHIEAAMGIEDTAVIVRTVRALSAE